MANPIQQLTLRRELDDAAAARRKRRKSEAVGGRGGGGGEEGELLLLLLSGCPAPVVLLRDLARLLWMYATLFALLTGGGLVSVELLMLMKSITYVIICNIITYVIIMMQIITHVFMLQIITVHMLQIIICNISMHKTRNGLKHVLSPATC